MRVIERMIVVAVFVLLAETARANPPHLWVFGDSTVDSGWYKISPWNGSNKFDIYVQIRIVTSDRHSTTMPKL